MTNIKCHSFAINQYVRCASVTLCFWWSGSVHGLDFIPGMSNMSDGRTETLKNYMVYTNSTEAPRVSSKKPLPLKTTLGSHPQLGVFCEYAQLRKESEKSTDFYFGSKRRNSVSKFPRLTLTGFRRAYDRLSVEISYMFRENNYDNTVTETVQVADVRAGRNIIIDFAGINDTTGGSVDSTSVGAYATLHMKVRYYAADLVEASVKVTDSQGVVLYEGASGKAAQTTSRKSKF